MAKKFGLPQKYQYHLHYLLFYHLFFSLFFTWYILNFGGDSQGYWRLGMQQVLIHGEETWMKYFGESTTFILWLCYIPSKVFGLSYITGNILFGFLGFIGIRYLFILTAEYFPLNHKILNIPLFPAIFYMANFNFWTAGVGKDAICFWAIAWFMFAVQKYNSRWWQGLIAFFFVYMARPHMGQALIGGTAFAIILGSEIRREYKFVLGALALFGTFYLSSHTMEVLELDDLSLDSLVAYTGEKVGNLNDSHVGSGVDMNNYSLPLKIFTYMYRPIFIDAHNIMAFLSSIENALYLWLSLFIVRNWTPEALRDMPVFLKVGFVTFIPVTLAFANSLGNLGVIMRMKNMMMIYFVLFILFLIVYNKKLRYQKHLEKQRYYQKRQEIIAQKAAAKEENV
ncbi:hypothetical protein KZP23_14865 [Echinicola marina]|uniref:hypothetical protein n=1 Tax=Echinicola marina TaxID=2859768 RepID=UPI001CF6F91B|nr:hypothetical protein [Echinicola marina]UCS92000.1 hypothetical protein KZP23_14865 [Echinicola marina]